MPKVQPDSLGPPGQVPGTKFRQRVTWRGAGGRRSAFLRHVMGGVSTRVGKRRLAARAGPGLGLASLSQQPADPLSSPLGACPCPGCDQDRPTLPLCSSEQRPGTWGSHGGGGATLSIPDPRAGVIIQGHVLSPWK